MEDTMSSKAAYKGHKVVPRLPQGFVATFKSLVTFKSTFYTKITKKISPLCLRVSVFKNHKELNIVKLDDFYNKISTFARKKR